MSGPTDFLSNAWIEALDSRLRSAGSGSSPKPLTVQYIVDQDGESVEYQLLLGPENDSAKLGKADHPDVTFSMDAATALAMSSGQLSTEEAFITGQLQIQGDPTLLIDAYRSGDDA